MDFKCDQRAMRVATLELISRMNLSSYGRGPELNDTRFARFCALLRLDSVRE